MTNDICISIEETEHSAPEPFRTKKNMKLLHSLFVLLFQVYCMKCDTILEQLSKDGGAKNFVELVYSSGLNASFEGEGPLTLFVPIDEAFTKLPQELVANLTSDPDLVRRLLLSHLVSSGQKLDISSLNQEDLLLQNALGTNLRVNVYLKSKFYEGFVTVNGKSVNKADLQADNGIIHFVTDVIFPEVVEDIPAKLASDGRFTTLLTAIEMAGLGDMLTKTGPFTLFAPSDEAFGRIPKETLKDILEDKDILAPILMRHVIPSATLHAKGISWQEHDTVDGQRIATQVFKNGVIKVAASVDSSAFVIESDLLATNGVIHVIDAVI